MMGLFAPIAFLVIVVGVVAYSLWQGRTFKPGKGWRHYGRIGNKVGHYKLPAPDFDFGEPHMMTRDCKGLVGTVHARWRITGDNFKAVDGGAPLVSLHFQREGDNWTGKGQYSGYRWWSRNTWPLEAGEYEAIVPLLRENWIPVLSGGYGFSVAKQEAVRIGFSFGGKGGRAHGAIGNGRFELISLEVKR